MSLMSSVDPGVLTSALPDGDLLFSWLDGTVYGGLSYKPSLEFPTGEGLLLWMELALAYIA